MSKGLDNLKHIVVLMMENRSFDHMLGALKAQDSRIDGITPDLSNPDSNGGASRCNRFRAPNLLLLRESFEHLLWGPFGFTFVADQGKLALTRGDVGFDHLKHSFGAGLTLRGGGLPAIFLTFSWGATKELR